jgi:hypothetical protein
MSRTTSTALPPTQALRSDLQVGCTYLMAFAQAVFDFRQRSALPLEYPLPKSSPSNATQTSARARRPLQTKIVWLSLIRSGGKLLPSYGNASGDYNAALDEIRRKARRCLNALPLPSH